MKILYYASHPFLQLNAPTGYGRHMREMIAAWESQGHEVRAFIAGDRNGREGSTPAGTNQAGKNRIKKWIPKLIWESLKDISLLRFDKKLQPELEEQIANFQPDIIYERITYLQSSGIRASQKMGVKHIAEFNAPYPEERISFSGKTLLLAKAKSVEREILLKTYGAAVVSSALKDHLVNVCPSVKDRLKVIPNAVAPIELPIYSIESQPYQYLKNELVIGFVGSIFPYHGVDVLISAFAKLNQKMAKLLIVGDGMILDDMKALAEKKGVNDQVVFTGPVPHQAVQSFIELMDICCMAKSNWYGSPVKIFEYGLLQKAILAPDVIPVRDVMTERDALLVKPTEENVHAGLKKLIEDESFRKEIAQNWHNKVMAKYTWNQAAKTTLELCI
jgi:glycosyltransferase involved in cell wall biosynthesis